METAQFLARVLPPGNFIAVGYDRGNTARQKDRFTNDFFVANDYGSAAGLLGWASRKGFNAYHAMASFKLAQPFVKTPEGAQRYKGKRDGENAQSLKAFWLDLDIKREGDGKDPDKCFADLAEAISWVAGFIKARGFPRPSLVVNSGYGVHVYWILDEALPAETWRHYAQAFKASVVAHGYRGDVGVIADAARILRPPGTNNVKVATTPKLVAVLERLSGPDYANDMILPLLEPWVSAPAAARVHARAQTQAQAQAQSATASALASGHVSNIFQRRVAGHAANGGVGTGASAIPNLRDMASAGQANMPPPPEPKPKSFALIAQQCGQVEYSLARQGNGDSRDLWYLGHLTLAHFCADGHEFVHAISDGHPGYGISETDAAVAQVASEVAKDPKLGPPTCAFYEGHRSALCQACPHYRKITSPIVLGLPKPDQAFDLPVNYRRNNGLIEAGKLDAEGNLRWSTVLVGDVRDPGLHDVGRGKALSFTYERAGKILGVYAAVGELPDENGRTRAYFDRQGITLTEGCERKVKDLVMAWINKLIDQRAKSAVKAEAWGWSEDEHGALDGFAVGGRLYRAGGSVESVVADDVSLERIYVPRGTLEKWQQAFDFVCKDKPEFQAIVAAGFGAPLVKLTGYSGVVVSAWSKETGVGKSSAMTVAQGVWSSPSAQYALNDTTNFTLARIAMTRAMPAIWDEARATNAEQAANFHQMLFQLTQGKERGRMRADTSLRDVRLWETLLITASNRPLMDGIVAQDEGTEAGAVRVFEFPIKQPPMANTVGAQEVVALARDNYGRAGEVYAAWLAANHAAARKALSAAQHDFNTRLGGDSSERLHVAAMSVMYVGAAIAKKLGLAQFDLQSLHKFLCDTCRDLRAARQRDLPVGNAGFDLHEILSRFVSAHAGRRLVTNRFALSGRTVGHVTPVEIKWRPTDPRDGVCIHVGQDDKIMRITRTVFTAWCSKHNHSARSLMTAMIETWKAAEHRPRFAGGTQYALGQTWVIDIPLTDPDLAGYLGADEEADIGAAPSAPPGPAPKPGKPVRRNGLVNVTGP